MNSTRKPRRFCLSFAQGPDAVAAGIKATQPPLGREVAWFIQSSRYRDKYVFLENPTRQYAAKHQLLADPVENKNMTAP